MNAKNNETRRPDGSIRREWCLSDEGKMLYTVLTVEDQEREHRAKFGECGEIGNQIIEYSKNLRRSRSLTEGLNARQIARIERIRAERAAAKDNIHYHRECVGCGDTPCVKPVDPIDPPYCEDCSKVCDEINVDDRDSPNIFPYKKCAFCHERSSCGNYTDDDQWQCESCAPEEETCACKGCHHTIDGNGVCSADCRFGEYAGVWDCPECSTRCEDVEFCPKCE
jgi:hypothetical protein